MATRFSHRYFNPHWIALRLSSVNGINLPPRLLMNILGWTSRYSSEPEVVGLDKFVDPSKLAIDVGGAYGLYSWHLEKLARHCVTFEANPESARALKRKLRNATVHSCALSDEEGEASLVVPMQGGVEMAGLGSIEPSKHGNFKVKTTTISKKKLDSFEYNDIGFIKIDVEGHELSVLRGAKKTLNYSKPILLIEIEERHRKNAYSSVAEFLESMSYQRRDIPNLSPQNFLFVHKAHPRI